MKIRIVIEGQEGIPWMRFVEIARLCEELGFDALYRSDHYMSTVSEDDRACLDAWATLAGLAACTQTLKLGTLVSPVTFRHPSELAKVVTTVDHISNGRAELGIGAGWNPVEHETFGFPFPSTKDRVAMLEEQIEIICAQWAGEPFSFRGDHYTVEGRATRPRPVSQPHPHLLIGGSGGRATTRIAARWANEYNTPYASVEQCAVRYEKLMKACESAGRAPESMTYSLMTGFVIGVDEDELRQRAARIMHFENGGDDIEAFLASHSDDWIIGSPEDCRSRINQYAAVGIDVIYLQHLDFNDDDALRLIAREIAS